MFFTWQLYLILHNLLWVKTPLNDVFYSSSRPLNIFWRYLPKRKRMRNLLPAVPFVLSCATSILRPHATKNDSCILFAFSVSPREKACVAASVRPGFPTLKGYITAAFFLSIIFINRGACWALFQSKKLQFLHSNRPHQSFILAAHMPLRFFCRKRKLNPQRKIYLLLHVTRVPSSPSPYDDCYHYNWLRP